MKELFELSLCTAWCYGVNVMPHRSYGPNPTLDKPIHRYQPPWTFVLVSYKKANLELHNFTIQCGIKLPEARQTGNYLFWTCVLPIKSCFKVQSLSGFGKEFGRPGRLLSAHSVCDCGTQQILDHRSPCLAWSPSSWKVPIMWLDWRNAKPAHHLCFCPANVALSPAEGWFIILVSTARCHLLWIGGLLSTIELMARSVKA